MKGKWKNRLANFRFRILGAFLFLLLVPIFFTSYHIIPFTQISDTLLQTIIAAASIIVALIIGFLFNSYFNIKQMRIEKLSRFTELQNQLVPYQRAFYTLADQLLRKHGYDKFQLGRKLHDLQRDPALHKSDDYEAIIWVHSLYDAGSRSYDTPDFEITYSIISKEKLDELYEAVIQAWSLLGRYKHYKYILRALNLQDTQDFDAIIIADSSLGMQYVVKGITKNDSEDYRTMAFWETKLGECHDILERMRSNGRFIYSFISPDIKILSTYLIFISAFGILLPLFILSTKTLFHQIVPFLANLSLLGFGTYFSLSLVNVYRKLTSHELTLT